MDEKLQRKRGGKRLLVAAIGVATVSYVSTQSGCAADVATEDEAVATSDKPYDDEEESADVGVTTQALATTSVANAALPNTAIPVKIKPKWPPVGNLVPPPVGNLVPPPVGNLVPPPVGNLMAPPVDIAIDELAAVRGN